MSIFLGSQGRIALKRKFGDTELTSVVNESDVNTTKKRFSFDFQQGQLITGDQIEITRTDSGVLSFIAAAGWANSTQQSSGKWFIHCDELGGLMLYDTFANAVNGGTSNAKALAAISSDIPIKVKVENAVHRILGQVSGYELSTQVDQIDVTSLSDQFRSRYSSLMSGSGRISCAWDYRDSVSGSSTYEVPHYLMQLALRTEVGNEFSAQLFLKTEGVNPSGGSGLSDDMIWYEVNGVISSAAVQFSPGTSIDTTIDFVATGPIRLRVDVDPEFALLQENTDDILLDQDATSKLLLDSVQ